MPVASPAEERFWPKVACNRETRCWDWTASRHRIGYGQFFPKSGESPRFAHLVSYEWLVGKIPSGMTVSHACGNRGCVNPSHLKTISLAEHADSRKRTPIWPRFWSKVAVRESGCWEWTAYKTPLGYGQFGVKNYKLSLAHRFCYEFLRGTIPDGLSLDHLCRNPSCVNPDHLEPVSHRENMLRGEVPSARNAKKTHCKNGHLFSEENTIKITTYADGTFTRKCRACATEYNKKYWIKKKSRRHGGGA